ncbi:MAG: phosphate ABC transporter permease PstA [Bacillota bacterium]
MHKLARRKALNTIALGLCVLFAVVVMLPLFALLAYVTARGLQNLSVGFFTNLPAPPRSPEGGLGNALLGTLYMVGIGSAISLPTGLLAGVHLSEFGRGRLAFVVRFLCDVLTGVPSIVVGIFVYILLVRTLGTFSALAGGVALSIIMIPIITRTVEEILLTVPNDIREASLALGATSWRTTVSVVFPAASGGIVTGTMLAVARAAGETAPLLFTALNSRFWPGGLMEPTASLPVYIFTYAISPYQNWQDLAWAGAFVLVALLLVANIAAKFVAGRFGTVGR